MPKRPLSAYNLFFREQRQELLGEEISSAFPVTDQTKRKHRRSHGKVGFQEMASIIGKKWKSLSPSKRKVYEDMAAVEKAKYHKQVELWRNGQDEKESADEGPSEGKEEERAIDPAALAMGIGGRRLSDVLGLSGSSTAFVPGQGIILPSSIGASAGYLTREGLSATQLLPRGISSLPFSPNQGTLSSAASMMPSAAGLSDSGRMLSGATGVPAMLLSSASGGLGGDSEAGRMSQLQQLYELRVREAAALRQEMERSMGPGSASSLGGVGQIPQLSPGLQTSLAGSRRASLGSSIRSVPPQQQQFGGDYLSLSPSGQQQLRQAEEAWQRQLAFASQGSVPQAAQQQQSQQQQQPTEMDQLAALREHRARLLQQALENERFVRAEELQRLLRRPPGPGGV